MLSEQMENNSILENNTVNKKLIRRKKNTNIDTKNIIIIPTSDNYNAFLSHKYNLTELKQICRHYKLPVTGNKMILTNTIYKYLYLSYHATLIQRQWRKSYAKIYARLHGPAHIKRHLCVNETDFFTMDEIKHIPYNQFFSYFDSKDNMIYGFDIMSLYNLIEKSSTDIYNKNETEVLNPYTRTPISNKVKKQFFSLLFFADLLKEPVQVKINEHILKPVIYNIEQRAANLFNDIDNLGNYTNPLWYTELRRSQILLYVKELYDIWTYRAQLSEQIKNEICPQGGLFITVQNGDLERMSFNELQHTVLGIMEIMVRGGINEHSRYLGSTYVLCALTLVNMMAAEALPWLYESVAHYI